MRPFFDADGTSLYHGDCRDVLPELPAGSVDLVLTDPAYGKPFVGEGKAIRKVNIRADGARQGVRVVRQALFAALPLLKADAHVLVFLSLGVVAGLLRRDLPADPDQERAGMA